MDAILKEPFDQLRVNSATEESRLTNNDIRFFVQNDTLPTKLD